MAARELKSSLQWVQAGWTGPTPYAFHCAKTHEYAPVCSHDDVMFRNLSHAMCAGLSGFHDVSEVGGQPMCKRCGHCSPDHDPVCADSRLFKNPCVAHCHGHTRFTPPRVAAHGLRCDVQKPCVATAQYDPVCANGRVYSNRGRARCDGYDDATPALMVDGNPTCRAPCSSCPPDVYQPVCALGRVFENECQARCAGATLMTPASMTDDGLTCSRPCKFALGYDPVCGRVGPLAGKLFNNRGEAECSGLGVDDVGPPRILPDGTLAC